MSSKRRVDHDNKENNGNMPIKRPRQFTAPIQTSKTNKNDNKTVQLAKPSEKKNKDKKDNDSNQQKKDKPENTGKSIVDDLFAGIGSKNKPKPAQSANNNGKEPVNNDKQSKKEHKKAPQPPADDDDMGFGSDKQQRKTTEEGFYIYTYDELKFEEGGGTPLCPFDCECCYA